MLRILIAVGEFLHQLVVGWQFSSYTAYSPEAFPQYTFGEYFWLNFGAAFGLVPVMVGAVFRALYKRHGRPSLRGMTHASFLIGAVLLVVTVIIRSSHGWDVFVLGLQSLGLTVLSYLTINA